MQSPTNSNSYSVGDSPSSNRDSTNAGIGKQDDQYAYLAASVSPIATFVNDPKDDLDRILLHEDFPTLLAMAAKVKETRKQMCLRGEKSSQPLQYRPKTSLQPDTVLQSVERLKQTFLARPHEDMMIPRKRYPIIDALLEDSILMLQKEYECGEKWLQMYQLQHPNSSVMQPSCPTNTASSPKKRSGRGAKKSLVSGSNNDTNSNSNYSKEAIAVKYSKWQTDILMNWMISNRDQPFPDPSAIESLISQTGLSQTQIINWTTNVRKRNRKATCEGGKKPHHFIDFLFLAQDREQKQAAQVAPISSAQNTSLSSYGASLSSPGLSTNQLHHAKSPDISLTRSTYNQSESSQYASLSTSTNNNNFNISIQCPVQDYDLELQHMGSKEVDDDYFCDTEDTMLVDTCISRNIFDEVEPLPYNIQSDPVILSDFATKWFDVPLEPAILDHCDNETKNIGIGTTVWTKTTATSDNVGSLLQRQRSDQTFLDQLDDLDDHDIQKWVQDMGLSHSMK